MNAVLPGTFNFNMVADLFNGKIEKNAPIFSEKMEALIRGVCNSAEGRISSAELMDQNLRTDLIQNAFNIYRSTEGNKTSALLSCDLFKILSKKNNQHTQFTEEHLFAKTKEQIKHTFNIPKEMQKEANLQLFFKGLMENIASPGSIKAQIDAFQGMDTRYVKIFNREHAKLQGEILGDVMKLPKNQIMMMIQQLKDPESIFLFNQKSYDSTQKFVVYLEKLISKGDHYAQQFRDRLISGLYTVHTKYSPENPDGTPELTWQTIRDYRAQVEVSL